MNSLNNSNRFVQSAITVNSKLHKLEDCFTWLDIQKKRTNFNVQEIPFNKLEDWSFDHKGNLSHNSGRFFSIQGIKVSTNKGLVANWEQPIINQPEIGVLGIIVKEINNVLCFLMQAKIEPGNINGIQVSPTVQATLSNYSGVHCGLEVPFVEYFINPAKNSKVLIDQLQSEQGARFLKKRNRNMVIEVKEDFKIPNNFYWFTLGQIKEFLKHDNVVNMNSRSVISCIDFSCKSTVFAKEDLSLEQNLLVSEAEESSCLNSNMYIDEWINELKAKAQLTVKYIPLLNTGNWEKSFDSIFHFEHKYFEIIAVKTEILNREIQAWSQPMIKSVQEGIIAFLFKKINGTIHFLVQAKLEPGCLDKYELAPTVQCLTGDYRDGKNEYEVPYLEYVLNSQDLESKITYDTMLSEEGGRFYREQNRNLIIELPPHFNITVMDNYCWMTLAQIRKLIRQSSFVNIQARSLLSVLKYQ